MTVSNFYDDVHNADNIKAEEVAVDALKNYFSDKPVDVQDLRDQHLKWDLVLQSGRQIERVDIKHDSYYEKTNRIPFEVFHQRSNGVIDPSWGVNAKLHHIALVPWSFSKVVLIPLAHLRAYVAFCLTAIGRDDIESERDWKQFIRKNVGHGSMWTTYGWAIPQAGFEKYLKHFDLGDIVTIPTAPSLHRAAPRLLIGGKEVA